MEGSGGEGVEGRASGFVHCGGWAGSGMSEGGTTLAGGASGTGVGVAVSGD